ncbi:DUF6907 domain-containing protein [Streptomyces sp. NPDC057596]|uniref:DUF6907 domain-containing protein n=1 Tax=Streptomyces sp. NPDC057596 TaxID=3346178 RepID=UPI003693DE4D
MAEDKRRQPRGAAARPQDPRYGEGTVTLQTLDHGEVTIPEPTWCKGHEGQMVGSLSDVSHEGPDVVASVDTRAGGEVVLLRANLTHAPYLEIEPESHPVVYVEALEAASVDATELRMVAARLAVYAGSLRDLARQLDDMRRAES